MSSALTVLKALLAVMVLLVVAIGLANAVRERRSPGQ